MNVAAASGRLRKYEPLDKTDFGPFEEFEELCLQNIKEALKDVTPLRVDRAIFSHRSKVRLVLNSNRLRVAKYCSSDFSIQKKILIAYLVPKKRHPLERDKTRKVKPFTVARIHTSMHT